MDRRKFLKNSTLGMVGAGVMGGKSLLKAGEAKTDDAPKIKEYRALGRTGFKASDISTGAVFDESLLGALLDAGVNYIDTADVYAGGKAETLLGEILPEYPRGRYIVATKAFWPMSDAPTDQGLSRKHIVDSVEASLDRLRLS